MTAALRVQQSPQAPANLLPEGAFETAEGWKLDPATMKVVEEGGAKFVRITNDDREKAAALDKTVALPAGAKFVVVSAKMRVQNLKLGAEGWHEPRVALRFLDDKGQQAGGYPAMPNLRADTGGAWVRREVLLDVPDGATRLQLQPGLWSATGTLDLDDLSVRAFPDARAYYAALARPLPVGGAPLDLSAWSLPSAADFARASGADGKPVFRVRSSSGETELYATGLYALDTAGWASLDLSLNARVSGHEKGSSNWKAARVRASFLGEDGKSLGETTLANIGGDTKGVEEFRSRADLPAGARYVRFSLGFDHAKGTLDVASLTATPVQAGALTDAPAPQGLKWGEEKATATSGKRARIPLNGVWRFVPATGETERDPKAGWGYIKVPGDWKRDDAFVARGSGRLWQTFKGDELAQAWYERPVRIPADWDGRAVLLDLRRVSTDAVVYVDGKEAGRVVWPSGTVDLTPFVSAGKEHTLRVRVIATDDAKEVVQYMGYDQVFRKKAELATRGIIGDVSLLSRPRGAWVEDVFVRPSVRGKALGLDVTVAGVSAPGEATFTARLLDEKGNVEKTFTQKAALKASAGDGQQSVALSFPWADPRLWDLGSPNRYTLQLSAEGASLSDEYPQAFGFREFWIEGRRFFLNGVEIRLRPNMINTGAANGGAVNAAKKLLEAGFNFGEYWPDDIGRRGSPANVDPIYEDADSAGLPVSANALSMPPFIFKEQWDKDPAWRAEYRRHMETELRRVRNHPSVIMYSTSANAFGHPLDQDPRYIGKVGYGAVQEYHENYKRAKWCLDAIKSFDPTRPVFTHHGAWYGDFHTCNHYLNMIPLQEREEWLSEWSKSGEVPYSAIEFGTPLYSSFLRGRDGYGHAGRSEPLMTEYCAIYFGSEAFATEPADYRDRIPKTFKGGQEYDSWFQHGDKTLIRAPAFQKLQHLFITNTWRSWRTWGITGGMLPWEGGHESPAVAESNGPTLAWIAGPQKRFTDKSHSFPGGAKVEKSAVLLNDKRTAQPYSATWAVTVGGKTVSAGSKSGTIAPATNLFLPVAFAAPKVAAKADGRVTLTARIGGREHMDAFAFRVFPAPAPSKAAPSVYAFDPAGETTAMLKSLGYAVAPVKPGGALPKNGTLVIGRKALSNRAQAPGDLAAFVRRGGRLLVMAQDPDWMRLSLHLRTVPYVTRRVFRADPAHPIVAGLDDADLRDWSGAGRLVEPTPSYPGWEWQPRHGWRWGNRGSVSSAAVEKPHRSSWRPLLECEFDLAYSPLMEMEHGRGRVTLCTLDVEDYVAGDPAARRLAAQVLRHVTAAPVAPKAARVVYVGGDAGAKTLDLLGVRYERASTLGNGPGLVVVGPDVRDNDPALNKYLAAGGRALFLMRRGEGAAPLGASVTKAANFRGSLRPPLAWPEAKGLTASDLRWRAPHDALLLSGAAVEIGADGLLARKKVGKGVAVFAQIDPSFLPADEKTFLRFTRWRQTRALSQILANLGATFRQDEKMLALFSKPDHGHMLAGTWDAQLTNPVKEAPTRIAHGDPGMTEKAKALVAVNAPSAGWQRVPVPAYQESYGGPWKYTDGEAVFRTTVDVPAHLAGRDLWLSVGRVDETDETFFNGQKVGGSSDWLKPRGYRVPGRLVKAGKNVIAVRTWDAMIHGGMCADPTQLFLRVDGADPGFYHPDYKDDYGMDDFKLADNPYRYYRW